MEKDKSYNNLLHKMLRIERLGYVIYKSLALKVKDNQLRLVYERLALNEQETAKYIENEISALANDYPVSGNGVTINLVKFACSILTAGQIAWILKNILKRRMYSRWYNIYRERNQVFWLLLLNHENLQHEFLLSVWSNKKGGTA